MSAPATVLIVDDQVENIRVLFQLLRAEGYTVLVARGGAAALERARYTQPGLILLDVLMPEMDGFEVCRQLKSDPQTRSIPVIFMTALSETRHKLRGFEVGADDYITKPFQQQEVLARARARLEIARLQRDLERRNTELQAFAHTVAHDLKRPLSSAVGSAELLLRRAERLSDADPRLLRGLGRIVQSGRQMGETIDALLLLAEVAHPEEVPQAPLDMERLVRQVLTSHLAEQIETLEAQIEQPSRWPVARGYAPWIRQVWLNYLENALRYGGRPPRLVLGGEQLAGGSARFWVQDNGPGLDSGDRDRLFAPFTRLHLERGEGHGLGLTIVHQIVTKLGGEVGVESTPGVGSVFWFTLELEPG